MLDERERERFCRARRAVIESEFSALNPQQRQAVLATEGPLLLLAGAGSGKTTVLINRVANLMKYGRGSDCGEVPDSVTREDLAFLERYAGAPDGANRQRAVELCRVEPAAPWSILAITFTNKAAGELKTRLSRMIGAQAEDVWASTFHSCCARILRRDIDRLGYSRSFAIYDTADSERVVKDALRALELDEKAFPPKSMLGYISRAKDAMQLSGDFAQACEKSGDYRLRRVAEIYAQYEKRLRSADALDFDDLILQTVLLLKKDEEVRRYYQRKFRYVLVDEYQDTNHLQYELASLLAGGYENFCVVGDDDQSIYRFRGATIENILSFEKQYKGCRTIRLEQNYRSTQNILEAANAVIRNNQGRKGKELWTDRGGGDKVMLYTAMNQDDEAQYVAAQILAGYSGGRKWSDFAILYRMNAQSRELEMAMKRNGVPYKVIGGIRFFDRAEVKDMLSYLCVLHNPEDDLRLQRIINNPPRGIGQRTVDTAQDLAERNGLSLWDVITHAGRYAQLQKPAGKLAAFVKMIETLRARAEECGLVELYDAVCTATGYTAALEAKGTVEDRTRLENVRELGSSIQSYVDGTGEPTLAGFLDEIALYTDLDSHDASADSVVMMTMHSAKGLEFPVVFVVGAEEGLFPGIRSIGDAQEMEEERRLCYVAMTRAKEKLYMTCAGQRMLYGRTSANRPSRFLEEIPEERLERGGGRGFGERLYAAAADGRLGANPDGGEETNAASPRQPRRVPRFRAAERGYTAPGTDGTPSGAGPGTPGAAGAAAPDFRKGDQVRHKAFGSGLILTVTKMGNDALLEVAFESVGTKRLMLRAAAQYMEKL